MASETLVSVDIEFDGPIPGDFSMTAIGACLLTDPSVGFYRVLKPITSRFDPETAAVAELDRSQLIATGTEPIVAMQQFADWIAEVCGASKPVMTAYGLGKEWTFVDWYFWHFLGHNPFGHNGIDMNSYAMGMFGIPTWDEVSLKRLPIAELSLPRTLSHNALEDAVLQAQTFKSIKHYREKQL